MVSLFVHEVGEDAFAVCVALIVELFECLHDLLHDGIAICHFKILNY